MPDDFSALRNMKYSGRGITIGMTPNGNPFVGYSLTGRSSSSQARRLVYDENLLTVRTEVTDSEQLKKGNSDLLIYPAIISVGNKIVASNGAQTNLLLAFVYKSYVMLEPRNILYRANEEPFYINGIDVTSYEPDAPNFTPRINGCLDDRFGAFCIIKKSEKFGINPIYNFGLEPGKARLITTYKGGNENPLLSFDGNPLEARIDSTTTRDICESIYDAIGPKQEENYRVSSAVMLRDDEGKIKGNIINRSERSLID